MVQEPAARGVRGVAQREDLRLPRVNRTRFMPKIDGVEE
jgi:hypothetical protein